MILAMSLSFPDYLAAGIVERGRVLLAMMHDAMSAHGVCLGSGFTAGRFEPITDTLLGILPGVMMLVVDDFMWHVRSLLLVEQG
jgi:hypothetical protein